MREHELKRPDINKRAKRLGRGLGSGKGTYAGKGMKGQKARTGVHIRPGFEGGQLPFIKRMPHHRGFRNPSRVEYQVVNVASLERFESGATVTPEALLAKGLVSTLKMPVKILGDGELTKKLDVTANRFSGSAKEKIEAAKGKVEVIGAAAADPAE